MPFPNLNRTEIFFFFWSISSHIYIQQPVILKCHVMNVDFHVYEISCCIQGKDIILMFLASVFLWIFMKIEQNAILMNALKFSTHLVHQNSLMSIIYIERNPKSASKIFPFPSYSRSSLWKEIQNKSCYFKNVTSEIFFNECPLDKLSLKKKPCIRGNTSQI